MFYYVLSPSFTSCYELFHRNDTYPKKNEIDQFLPKMSYTCSLAVHACDLVQKNFFLTLGTFGGNSNNTHDWMVEILSTFMQTSMPTLTKVVFNFKCYVQSVHTVCYDCAHFYFSSHLSWCYLEGLKTT